MSVVEIFLARDDRATAIDWRCNATFFHANYRRRDRQFQVLCEERKHETSISIGKINKRFEEEKHIKVYDFYAITLTMGEQISVEPKCFTIQN